MEKINNQSNKESEILLPQQSPLPQIAENDTEDNKKQEQQAKKVIDFATWVLIFTIAIIKDIIDIFGSLVSLTTNVVPILGQAACVILQFFLMGLSLVMGALLFFLLFFKGKLGIHQKMRQIVIQLFGSAIDSVPIISFIPITSLVILIVFFMEKSGLQKLAKPLKKSSGTFQKITGGLLKI